MFEPTIFDCLKCVMFGHQFRVVKVCTESVRRIECPRCRNEWAMNDELRAIIPWGKEIAQLYDEGWNMTKEM